MGLFNQFPFTNFHELNLDWLINEVKTLKDRIDNEKTTSTIGIKNVLDFGAVGDGVADDSKAFQDAADSGFDIYVPTDKGQIYLIKNTINIHTRNQCWFSDPSTHPLRASGHISYTGSFACFAANTCYLTFSNLMLTYDGSAENVAAFYINGSSTENNNDSTIYGCRVVSFPKAVVTYGRGVRIINNLFFECNGAIDLYYDFSYGGIGVLQNSLGYRAFFIVDNRFHNCKSYIVKNWSNSIYQITIARNIVDGGAGDPSYYLVSAGGTIRGCIITDNYIMTGFGILTSSNTVSDSIISNNILDYPNTATSGAGPVAIALRSSCSNLNISNNLFSHAGGTIQITGASNKNIIVNGNTFIACGTTYGSTYFAVRFNDPNAIFTVVNNSFVPPDDFSTAYIAFSSTAINAKNSQIIGNSGPAGVKANHSVITAGDGSSFQTLV